MNRHKQREYSFRLLFSLEQSQKEELEAELEVNVDSLDLKEEADKERIKNTILDIYSNMEIIDGYIKEATERWSFERIGKIELAILRIAIFEMKYREMPISVAINEAVELSKIYGEENSSKFVNGVLGQIVKRLV